MNKGLIHNDVVYNSVKLLQSRGLSVVEIAERSGVSTWTIYSILRGANARVSTHIALQEVINVTEPQALAVEGLIRRFIKWLFGSK